MSIGQAVREIINIPANQALKPTWRHSVKSQKYEKLIISRTAWPIDLIYFLKFMIFEGLSHIVVKKRNFFPAGVPKNETLKDDLFIILIYSRVKSQKS